MNRALLLLPMTALAAGCYAAPPCDPEANVYWGFTVPGLGVAQTCSGAQVDAIRIFVDGAFVEDVPCAGPAADGIQLVGFGHGARRLQLEARSGGSNGTLRYTSDGTLDIRGCTTNRDVVLDGVSGDLDLRYLFAPVDTCLANSYAWYQLRDAANVSYDVAPVSTRNVCGEQPIGPLDLPAGVYTLSKFEVGQLLTATTWAPDYNACAPQTFVHAGVESLTTTLVPAAASCW